MVRQIGKWLHYHTPTGQQSIKWQTPFCQCRHALQTHCRVTVREAPLCPPSVFPICRVVAGRRQVVARSWTMRSALTLSFLLFLWATEASCAFALFSPLSPV